jgi:hypothetical protein
MTKERVALPFDVGDWDRGTRCPSSAASNLNGSRALSFVIPTGA